jgi:hypothetical protein
VADAVASWAYRRSSEVVPLIERTQYFLVVFDDDVIDGLAKPEGSFASCVPQTTIASQALLKHPP